MLKEVRRTIACSDLGWVAAFADIILEGDNWAGALGVACSYVGLPFPSYELEFITDFNSVDNWKCRCKCAGVSVETTARNRKTAKCRAAQAWIEKQLEDQ